MKCLLRNARPFYYCLYDGREDETDSDGYLMGDTRTKYKAAVRLYGNISPARGETRHEMFGADLRYDKVIVLDDPKCPINENTVLFVDKEPEYDGSGDPLFDYIVRRVARSLNSVSYAIEKVRVS